MESDTPEKPIKINVNRTTITASIKIQCMVQTILESNTEILSKLNNTSIETEMLKLTTKSKELLKEVREELAREVSPK